MAVVQDVSPYDDITSDDLFDSFMDVVSGVELTYNGDTANEDEDHDNTYEVLSTYTTQNKVDRTFASEKHCPGELRSCPSAYVPNDEKHLPLLVKLSSEPIYEVCSTSEKNPLSSGALISDLDVDDEEENECTSTDLCRAVVSSRCSGGNQDKKSVVSLNGTNMSEVPNYSSLHASVSTDSRTNSVADEEYAVVDKLKRTTPTDEACLASGSKDITSRNLEDLHKKIHFLRQKSLSSPNIELQKPPSSISTSNLIHNDKNNNETESGMSVHCSEQLERSPSKCSNSSNSVGLRRSSTLSSVDYTSVGDVGSTNVVGYDTDVLFTAEQIAYGFRKAQLINGGAMSQPSVKTQPAKDKRNFFGFSKWKSTDETSKTSYQGADDLGRDSKDGKTLSPPFKRTAGNIPVLCSGYLFKQGGTRFTPNNWRLRWFELKKDNCLYYYKSEQDHIPNGAVILMRYQVIRTVEVNKRFAFKLVKGGARTYYFAANSDEEMKKWMSLIFEATKTAMCENVSIPDCSLKNVSIPAVTIIDPDMHGYISKQGSTHKTWHKRYCVLKYGCLFYYEEMNAAVAIGVFKLHEYTINSSDHIRYGFEAVPPVRKMRTYYFTTGSDTETRRWVEAMRRSIKTFH